MTMDGNHYEKVCTVNATLSLAQKSLTTEQYFLVQLVVKKDGSFACNHRRTREAKTTTTKLFQRN